MLRKARKISAQFCAKIAVFCGLIAVFLVLFAYREPLLNLAENQMAKWLDARVQSVLVEGVENTPRTEISTALALQKGDSLVRFDAQEARKRLEALPWVKKAAVSRRLPSTLMVEVFEYTPFARLKTAEGVWVVDKTGHRIVMIQDAFPSLPVLVGEEAEVNAARLFAFLMDHPNLLAQLVQADFIGQRRWNLRFKSGLLVKLPEEGEAEALTILQQLEQRRHVLSLASGRVDLRLRDKVILELGEEDEKSGFFF